MAYNQLQLALQWFQVQQQDGTSRLGHLTRDVLTLMGAFSVGDYFPAFGWVDILTGLTGRMNKTHADMDALGFDDNLISDFYSP
ncbi:hypothetical protein C5167_050974 [Papaver somniferum]|uniref:Uncharacterized protein n=1 Tax=Papaver somniferum TaxID=3469 RepID=A0A4Y7KQ50_PAPSO|nr:hypothetical protein C5167_050974 [Papaver somniferum]